MGENTLKENNEESPNYVYYSLFYTSFKSSEKRNKEKLQKQGYICAGSDNDKGCCFSFETVLRRTTLGGTRYEIGLFYNAF